MLPEQIQSLLEKYLAGTISSDEMKDLTDWYNSFDDAAVPVCTERFQNKEGLRKHLLARVNAERHKPRGAQFRQRKRGFLAAASLLLICVASASVVLLFQKENTTETVLHKPSKPLPGTSKATIHLPDGKRLAVSNSVTAEQKLGNLRVMVTPDGWLTYSPSTESKPGIEAGKVMLQTPRGGEIRVVLPDGTKVWLNADSRLTFPQQFSRQHRTVALQGEGYFEVAKSAGRPFRVNTSKALIEVVGTRFNVSAYHDEEAVTTTVIEGSVSVAEIDAAGNTAAKLLVGGLQSSVIDGEQTISKPSNLEEPIAWKNGELQFDAAPVERVLREVSRWYDVEIVYAEKPDLHLSGQLSRNADIDQIVQLLELTGELKITLEPGKLIVSK